MHRNNGQVRAKKLKRSFAMPLLTAIALLLFFTTKATAVDQQVFNTLGANDTFGTTGISFFVDPFRFGGIRSSATAFDVGGNDFVLKSIEVPVTADGSIGPNGVTVHLRTSDPAYVNGRPEQVIEVFDFASQSISTTPTILKAQSILRPILKKNTRYWVHVHVKCSPACDGFSNMTENTGAGFWMKNSVGQLGTLVNYEDDTLIQTISGTVVPALRVRGEPDNVPWAFAGLDQNVFRGSTVLLDGSSSVFPVGAVNTSFKWSFLSKPIGSQAELLPPATATPSFVADVVGIYRLQLIVSDGVNDSDPDTVSIVVENSPPIANAGGNQSVAVGSVVSLDGSGSYDPDGNYPLTYSWSLVQKPTNSSAVIVNSSDVNATFTKDLLGDYTVRLIVTDASGLNSAPSLATISTFNTTPVAYAGKDQTVKELGSTVQLDGAGSYDEDGNPLTYQWSLISKPTGSQAVLSNSTAASPTFVADVRGEYRLSLVVFDPYGFGASDSVVVSFANLAPLADAGGNISAIIGDRVFIDATRSTDPDSDVLSYYWSFVSKPAGSQAILQEYSGRVDSKGNPIDLEPTPQVGDSWSKYITFVVDLPGSYVVSLVVSDGSERSSPSIVTVNAVSVEDAVTVTLINITETINTINSVDLRNPTLGNSLTAKVNSVLTMIDEERYVEALDKLQNDLIKKTDGCAARGLPDPNDWITSCTEQSEVYKLLLDVVDYLNTLIPN